MDLRQPRNPFFRQSIFAVVGATLGAILGKGLNSVFLLAEIP
jgi:hypothetical protein